MVIGEIYNQYKTLEVLCSEQMVLRTSVKVGNWEFYLQNEYGIHINGKPYTIVLTTGFVANIVSRSSAILSSS